MKRPGARRVREADTRCLAYRAMPAPCLRAASGNEAENTFETPGVWPRPKNARFRRNVAHRRRGLAPLEFVLALPILLFLAALMIVIGGVGLTKTRAEIAGRYGGWRNVGVRTGGGNPNPDNWDPPASLRGSGGTSLVLVDALWNQGALTEPAIRGPSFGGVRVGRQLEMHAGVHTGTAEFHQPVPMLRGVLPRRNVNIDLSQPMLGNQWEYHALGYGWNRARRARQWWEIEPRELGLADMQLALDATQDRLSSAPWRADLDPLDDDDELKRYGSRRDFHPRWPRPCESDADYLRSSSTYSNYLDRVSRVPGTMTRHFLSVFNRRISELEDKQMAGIPLTPAEVAELADLKQKVSQLQSFLESLPKRHGGSA